MYQNVIDASIIVCSKLFPVIYIQYCISLETWINIHVSGAIQYFDYNQCMYSLGISRIAEQCPTGVLSDSQRAYSAIESTQVQSKSYKQIKKEVLSCVSRFWRETQQLGSRSGILQDFSKQYSTSFTTCLLSKNDIIRMLEASDSEPVD